MFRPASVVAWWTALNLVLASLMWVFGENPIFIGLYYVAALPLLLGAAIIRRSVARRPEAPAEFVIGQRAGLVLPIAIGCAAVGIGLGFERWLCIPAIVGTVLATWGLRNRATPE